MLSQFFATIRINTLINATVVGTQKERWLICFNDYKIPTKCIYSYSLQMTDCCGELTPFPLDGLQENNCFVKLRVQRESFLLLRLQQESCLYQWSSTMVSGRGATDAETLLYLALQQFKYSLQYRTRCVSAPSK